MLEIDLLATICRMINHLWCVLLTGPPVDEDKAAIFLRNRHKCRGTILLRGATIADTDGLRCIQRLFGVG